MTNKNFLYNLLIAASVTSIVSCAYASEQTYEEYSRTAPTSLSEGETPLFSASEQRSLLKKLESAQEACTVAVAQKIDVENARAVLQDDHASALETIRLKNIQIFKKDEEIARKNEEIEDLIQAQLRVHSELELQILELNQTVARLATRALEVEASRATEVQARQLAEANLLRAQQDRESDAELLNLLKINLYMTQNQLAVMTREYQEFRAQIDTARRFEESETGCRVFGQRLSQIVMAQSEDDRIAAEEENAARLGNVENSENQARSILNNHENDAHMSQEQLEREAQLEKMVQAENDRIDAIEKMMQAELDSIAAEEENAARLGNVENSENSENQARSILNNHENDAHMSQEQLEREAQLEKMVQAENDRIAAIQKMMQAEFDRVAASLKSGENKKW